MSVLPCRKISELEGHETKTIRYKPEPSPRFDSQGNRAIASVADCISVELHPANVTAVVDVDEIHLQRGRRSEIEVLHTTSLIVALGIA